RTVAMRDFPNNDSTPPKSTNQSELRWPFVLTAVNAAHKIKAAERFRSIKIAPSFNGRTADSGSAYRGSNPWGAANLESSTYLSGVPAKTRSEEHTSELQSRGHLVCSLLLEKKKNR